MCSAREDGNADVNTAATAAPRMSRLVARGALLTLSSSLASLGGCAARTPPKPDQLTDSSLRADPAMQRRDWDESRAVYPNGATLAGPTEFAFEPKRNQAGWAYYGADSATFLLN